jgi:WD40 repeat protein
MCIWEDKKLLLTASDKVIMLWDLISLTNVGTLKGHKDDIKTMTVS